MSTAMQWEGDDLLLTLQLQPRASHDGWAGAHGDAMKLRLTAAPVDGKANEALLKFLAGEFGVPKRSIYLLSGETSRRKRLRIASPRKLPPCITPK